MYKNKLTTQLDKCDITDVYFGFSGFRLIPHEDLEDVQLGYKLDPDGEEVTGEADGDWHASWYVFARDLTLDDPVFVDLSQEQLPVYTADRETEEWDPEPVSDSLENFIRSLILIRDTCRQDDLLLEPKEKFLMAETGLNEIQKKLLQINGSKSKDYWEEFIESYRDWVQGDDDGEDIA